MSTIAIRATMAVALVIPIAALAQDPSASQKSVQEQVVDSFNIVFGRHPGTRALHAKGIVLEGTFMPNSAAASLSKAAHFQKKRKGFPVTVRFSDSTGLPNIPDTDPDASPRGMAVKFHLSRGVKTDIVAHSFNGFPVATAADLRDFFLALGATKSGDPRPTALERFLSSHPAAKTFVEAPKHASVSYATLPYFGVNAFKFTNAKGTVTFGRYQLQPGAGEKLITSEKLAEMGPDYLRNELRERILRGPITFTLLVQIAEQGDKLDDPTTAWPDTRKKIELGTISITKIVKDNQAVEKKLLFTPGALVPGIEAADPMIAERTAAYIVSLSRRTQAR